MHNTYTEDGILITDPTETKKKHIANYFEDLYQAREGTEESKCWTKHIKEQVRRSLETRNKKAKTEKKPGSRQNPKWNLHWSDQRNEGDTKRSNSESP